ncbi:MAG: nucleoside kinase [Acidobacteriota bacterium]|nr:nucleoside kinase [Acidobacteriota bacterium]
MPVRHMPNGGRNLSEASILFEDRRVDVGSGATIMDLISPDRIRREDIVAAMMNHHLVSLHTPLMRQSKISPVTAYDPDGQAVVKRTVAHMMHSLLTEHFPQMTFVVGQSLLGGYYYEIYKDGRPADDLEDLAEFLTRALSELSSKSVPFTYHNVHVGDALEMVTDLDGAKRKLLDTWPALLVPLVTLGKFTDIPHGPYGPDTSIGKTARVIPYPPGLVLQFHTSEEAAQRKVSKLWACYRETRDWNQLVNIPSVGHLNEAILQDRIDDVIRVAEALHEKKIVDIVDDITERRQGVRAVCVAGPSSAGKSTFVRRLSVQLRVRGIEPVILGLDDYYLDRDKCPRDEEGELDFEALEALDLQMINDHLAALLRGDEVYLPRFNFATGKSSIPTNRPSIRLGANQILLLEGIHGLHPELTRSIPRDTVYKVFINALTQLVIDGHNRIFTADTRLIRRIIRDRQYRHTKTADTIARWPSVRRGERRHIFPNQEEAEIMFNSTLVYEHAVLKTYATRYLLEVPRDHPSRAEAYRLSGFLDLFVPILPNAVPGNSVLREFIGDSHLDY